MYARGSYKEGRQVCVFSVTLTLHFYHCLSHSRVHQAVAAVKTLDHKFELGAGGATVVDKLQGFAGDEVYAVQGKKGQQFSPSQK